MFSGLKSHDSTLSASTYKDWLICISYQTTASYVGTAESNMQQDTHTLKDTKTQTETLNTLKLAG